MAKGVVRSGALIAILLIVAAAATASWAQGRPEGERSQREAPLVDFPRILHGVASSVIYSLLGLMILILGFKIFDLPWITPFSLNKEIAEDDNTAAGLVVAGLLIALGIIIAAAIH